MLQRWHLFEVWGGVMVCVVCAYTKVRGGYQRSQMRTEDRADSGGRGALSWRRYGFSGEVLMSVLDPEDFMPGVRM
ncbi:hypothetical protein BU25DRAFT_146090 [Macroventuria anomochaeta]|uniref:Uncharacterized protein n=1 Tax=Macroventuria anomochaeta TaxID=301207 RepID=A0ACB6SD77_9PLEO|nr:uncharacterized protein BU25DRAFT_146090 [Macroventuria anomochaeta]KAF2632271.1 hypothetical protein BU25DRAFT_146090 [Macroventuria anomochaeta]